MRIPVCTIKNHIIKTSIACHTVVILYIIYTSIDSFHLDKSMCEYNWIDLCTLEMNILINKNSI